MSGSILEVFTNKVWGETKPVFANESTEVHYLRVKAGGYSSRHRHRKHNMFLVLKGELTVTQYRESTKYFANGAVCGETLEPSDITKLAVNIPLSIPPGVWHKFEAHTACELVEIYWTESIDPADIERMDEGGLNALT